MGTPVFKNRAGKGVINCTPKGTVHASGLSHTTMYQKGDYQGTGPGSEAIPTPGAPVEEYPGGNGIIDMYWTSSA